MQCNKAGVWLKFSGEPIPRQVRRAVSLYVHKSTAGQKPSASLFFLPAEASGGAGSVPEVRSSPEEPKVPSKTADPQPLLAQTSFDYFFWGGSHPTAALATVPPPLGTFCINRGPSWQRERVAEVRICLAVQ